MPRTISQIARRCQILAILAVGFSPFAAGCDQCAEGETRCSGEAVLSTCVFDSHGGNYWSDMTCPLACGEVDGEAMCVGAVP
jgi:hypothetical protein